MDMKTHTVEWSYEPVKRLTLLRNKESTYMDKIIVSNTFSTYDRLYSITEKDKFAYLSNDFGLQLIDKGFFYNVYEMSINETAFMINEDVIVNNVNNMKLEYDSIINLLLLSNSIDNYIWKYHGYIAYDQLKSNNNVCNNYDLIYTIKYKNENGNIITNNNINSDIKLVLKSSRGEYKWCNIYIYNRPLYASKLYINDSFTKGEILYCNNYSLIILDSKLIYRDHVKLTEEVVYEIPNVNLVELVITDRNLVLISDNKVQCELANRLSNRNINTFLSCNFNDNSVYWDDSNGKVLWKYPKNELSTNTKANAVWLYIRYYDKYLYAEPYEPITYEDCKNKEKYKWYFENIDIDGNCDNNTIMKYIKTSKFIKSNDKCISGIDNNNDPDSQYYVKLISCDRHNEKQLWELISDIEDIN
ncbi:hypothetical protein BCR36DRAFT_415805 [Piromyces finnis]|uniref:Uncharacterized protein n=1 Tax=Piromyces finnis TaxID=1754191 RepID=A0A1Y1UXG6_9FUNG|nr:hypothetical protein BCR36DRAFT_415805 [Piromyces finnis]|eukprot:ORX42952.1 hypothetical protein BCR36DRAFT_415805 [Piromyces finnis]